FGSHPTPGRTSPHRLHPRQIRCAGKRPLQRPARRNQGAPAAVRALPRPAADLQGGGMRDSREDAKARRDVEEVAAVVVDTAIQLHRDWGPGLLESVYEAVLARMLEQRGLMVERQKPVPIDYQDIRLDEGFRLDLLVDGQL